MKRNDEVFSRYCKDIARFVPLNQEEERALVDRIRKGDPAARATLMMANLRVVIGVAKKYRRWGSDFLDLIGEGNTGLLRAFEVFDERKDSRFVTYAVWWIHRAIYRAYAYQVSQFRLPCHVVKAISRLRKSQERLEQNERRQVSWNEIAEWCRYEEQFASDVFYAGQEPLSFDRPFSEEEGIPLSETLADTRFPSPENILSSKQTVRFLREMIARLGERERLVVTLHFGIEQETCCSLKEIGEKLHITAERARQIKEEALKRLRKAACRIMAADGWAAAN
jgi:RNA polymerase primary sigma factor